MDVAGAVSLSELRERKMSQFHIENQGANSFLVYELNRTEKVDSTGLGMIANNRIPNVLPVSFTQVNSEQFLRYPISGTVTLRNYLQGSLLRDRALKIFESICEALCAVEEYLLDENGFLLEPDYIFVETATGRAQLVYLAVLNGGAGVSYAAFFKTLTCSIKTNESEDCSYIAQILNHLNTNENFSIHQFMQLIRALQVKEWSPAVPEPAEQKQTTHPQGNETPQTRQQAEPKKDAKRKREPRQFHTEFEVPGGLPNQPVAPGQTEEEESDQEKIGLLFLLRNFSGENLKKFRKQHKKPKKAEQQEGAAAEAMTKPAAEEILPEVPGTTLLQEDYVSEEATTCLPESRVKVAYLLRKSTQEKIPINQYSFKMGRSHKGMDYTVEGNSAIGRQHAVIFRREQGFVIVDMDSKNHTFINDDKIPPNQEVTLPDHCVLRLADEEFLFTAE